MRIIIVFNPISGAGRAAVAAAAAAESLRAAGHDGEVLPTLLEPPRQWLDGRLHEAGLLVVVGGDGAVRLAAGAAARTGTPIYTLPMGTENLFAREFGMDRRSETLLRAVDRNEVRRVDMGMANGRVFLMMASIGFDAEVVHDLAGRRGTSISPFSYLPPIWSQIRRWRPPHVDVTVDGEPLDVGGEPGFVVVANSRHYGWRLNPGGRASMSDGVLDVAFFPTRSRAALIGWALKCRLQRHLRDKRLIYRLGRQVTIRSAQPQKYQLDGDPPGVIRELAPLQDKDCEPDRPLVLDIGIQPSALRVLVP